MSRKAVIVTGEVSGDIYGGLLASEIKKLDPQAELSGVGAERMRAAGVKTFLDSDDLSVMGIWEAITRLRRLRKALNFVQDQIKKTGPDLLILIDYPGMNLRLATFAHRMGLKVMYYVSPQVWAWGKGRIRSIKNNVDKMVVILPFEEEIYRAEGVDVSYVGHPLIDIVKTEIDRGAYLDSLGLGDARRLVALLPGSRPQEIRHHTRPLVRTAMTLRDRMPSLEFVMVSMPSFEELVRREIESTGEDIRIVSEHRYETLRYSDLAITCSGTATLEGALLGTPMIVIYKLALFSWALGKMIVKVPHISLANLVAGDRVVPEFLQNAVNPQTLAAEAEGILTDDARRRGIVSELNKVRSKLGQGGASQKSARIAVSLMSG
jgi:lipid-A-disaccharide synthase